MTATVSVALSLFTAFIAVGRSVSDLPTKEQVSQQIQTESPYVRDQALVREALAEIKAMRGDITELKSQVNVIEERTRR